MEFTKVLACLLVVAAPAFCDLADFGGGSYTGSLVRGLGRHSGLGKVGAVRGLDCNCPLGTICDIDTGACIPRSGALVSAAGLAPGGVGGLVGAVGGAVVPVGVGLDGVDEFGNPIVVGGGLGKGVIGGELVGGAGYGNGGLVVSRCGYMSQSCRASAFDRFPKCKYTFSHRLQRCVKVNVCKSCGYINGPDANLFDTLFDCQRICHI